MFFCVGSGVELIFINILTVCEVLAINRFSALTLVNFLSYVLVEASWPKRPLLYFVTYLKDYSIFYTVVHPVQQYIFVYVFMYSFCP